MTYGSVLSHQKLLQEFHRDILPTVLLNILESILLRVSWGSIIQGGYLKTCPVKEVREFLYSQKNPSRVLCKFLREGISSNYSLSYSLSSSSCFFKQTTKSFYEHTSGDSFWNISVRSSQTSFEIYLGNPSKILSKITSGIWLWNSTTSLKVLFQVLLQKFLWNLLK